MHPLHPLKGASRYRDQRMSMRPGYGITNGESASERKKRFLALNKRVSGTSGKTSGKTAQSAQSTHSLRSLRSTVRSVVPETGNPYQSSLDLINLLSAYLRGMDADSFVGYVEQTPTAQSIARDEANLGDAFLLKLPCVFRNTSSVVSKGKLLKMRLQHKDCSWREDDSPVPAQFPALRPMSASMPAPALVPRAPTAPAPSTPSFPRNRVMPIPSPIIIPENTTLSNAIDIERTPRKRDLSPRNGSRSPARSPARSPRSPRLRDAEAVATTPTPPPQFRITLTPKVKTTREVIYEAVREGIRRIRTGKVSPDDDELPWHEGVT